MTTVRIVVADDHAVVRAGIANALRSLTNIKIVGEAGDGGALLSILESTNPDLLVTDVTMPNFEPIEAVRNIRARFPALKILIVSAYDDNIYIQGLLGAGVNGYHLKDQSLSDLRLAVQQIIAGKLWFSGSLVEKLVHSYDTPTPTLILTVRQREMLSLLRDGLDNFAIARRTGLSIKTVENHLTRLYRQINVQSRLEAVSYCAQHPDVLAEASTRSGHTEVHAFQPPVAHSAILPAILIVDDNTRYRTQMKRMVGKNYPEAMVYEAENIELALRIVGEVRPGLVFVDVVLGDEHGIDCAAQIKALAPTTRVVLISAYPDREFRRAGLAAGAVAFLDKKDLNNATLREVIADLAV